MPQGTKIATCCYCGTRAALVLRGNTRHELSCATCGAPLRSLKSLRTTTDAPQWPAPSHRPAPAHTPPQRPKPAKRRKRKSLSRRIMAEAFDLIEDLLD
jgi:hypothetical protein